MQRAAACLASWFSMDGPLSPDCSAPLSVSQLTKLRTADSPLTQHTHSHIHVCCFRSLSRHRSRMFGHVVKLEDHEKEEASVVQM